MAPYTCHCRRHSISCVPARLIVIIPLLYVHVVLAACPSGYTQYQNRCIKCPSSYTLFHDKCYKWHLPSSSWQAARTACQRDSGDLISLHDQSFFDHIRAVARSRGRNVWIGANDIVHEGRWVWVDGTSVSHSLYYWYPGEPNNDNNEDCAGLATGYGSKMNDYTCTWGGLEYICERKVLEKDHCSRNSGTWGQWSSCSRSCAGGTRTRQCPYDYPVTTEHGSCQTICLNGGTFTQNQCHCIVGTSGTCCEVLERNVCYHHNGTWSSWGSCSQSCGGGTRTRHCQYDHPPSTDLERCNQKCLNDGEFYDEQCHCVPGTTGPCCHDIVECASNPCKNGGTCEEHINSYYCICPPGTVQPNCDDIPNCACQPCKYNSTCNEHVNGYTCNCVAGTTGVNCDDILECSSNPCLNGGTCEELIGGYKCHCVTGTVGPHCIDIPECASNPCQNAGVCNELINGYSCTCKEQFAGLHCHKDLLIKHDETCRPGGSCYTVFTSKDTWLGAKEFCEARRGHLAVPDDMAEQLFLETYLTSMRVRYPEELFWIGGQTSATYPPHWVTGHLAKYSRWPTGASTSTSGSQCLTMDGTYDFKWRAYPCDRPTYFICEERY